MSEENRRGKPLVSNPEAEQERDQRGQNPAVGAMRAGRAVQRGVNAANDEVPKAAAQAKGAEAGSSPVPQRTLGSATPAGGAAAAGGAPVQAHVTSGQGSGPGTADPSSSGAPATASSSGPEESMQDLDSDADVFPAQDGSVGPVSGGQTAGGSDSGDSSNENDSADQGDSGSDSGSEPSDHGDTSGGLDGGSGDGGQDDPDQDGGEISPGEHDPALTGGDAAESQMGDVSENDGSSPQGDEESENDQGGDEDSAGEGSEASDGLDAADASDVSPGAVARMGAAAANALNGAKTNLADLGARAMGTLSGGGMIVARVVGAQVGSGAAAMVMVAMILSGFGIGGAAVYGHAQSQALRQEGSMVNVCGPEDVRDGQRQAHEGGDEDGDVTTEQNAELVYSVLSAWGMPDENIAGILGNWTAESGIDPTGVETVFDERHRIGETKGNYESKDFVIRDIPELSSYSARYPAIHKLGIGLGQWTDVGPEGGRNTNLRNYAESIDRPWHELETQLGFLLHESEGPRAEIIRGMIEGTNPGADSVSEATQYFLTEWEGINDHSAGARQTAAAMWFTKMPNWSADEDLANSILEEAETSVSGADRENMITAGDECVSEAAQDGSLTLHDGGLSVEEAQQLVDLYNEEGQEFLMNKYQGGGPGACNGDYRMNCVSFSVYFVNKYTEITGYPVGNGIQTAYSISDMGGSPMSSTPTAYSIGSGPGSSPAGHTLVVLGVEGDNVIVGEAGYCSYIGRVRVESAERMAAAGWKFTDVNHIMLPPDEVRSP